MLSSLDLINFRNLKKVTVKFGPGLNIFFGDNAQGKTNLLEAVYLLSSGKSFRAETDQELISWGVEMAKITAKADHLDLEVKIEPAGKKLLVNRQPKRLVDLVGEFSTVLFAPEDLLLVSGPPQLRRAWINSLIARVDREYLSTVVKLNQVIKNRNRLLWQIKQGFRVDLKIWNEQLASLAVAVWLKRDEKIAKFNQILKKLSPKLGLNQISLELISQIKLEPAKELRMRVEKKLASLEKEEVERSQTLLGPQRDDLKIIFELLEDERILTKDVAVFGSRGEQRTAVLALKLVEIELIETERSVKPTLLLDDVLSEFDLHHRQMIQGLLYSQQSLITTTSLDLLDAKLVAKATIYQVKKGKVESFTDRGVGKELSA